MSAHHITAAANSSLIGWVNAIKALGITTVLLLGFFYYVTQNVDRRLMNLESSTQSISSTMSTHVDATGRVNAETLFYLRALCVQGARQARTDPRDCVPPR